MNDCILSSNLYVYIDFTKFQMHFGIVLISEVEKEIDGQYEKLKLREILQ